MTASVLAWTLALAIASPAPQAEAAPAPPAEEPAGGGWAPRFSLYGYLVPEGDPYLVPIVAVDHRWLHLEARYNYESREAGSVWAGYTLEWDGSLRFALTPILGGVFGSLNGVGTGVEWSLDWWRLELYSEWEFVLDVAQVDESYFYAWSEAAVRLLDWLRVGLALQRTRVTGVPVEVSWGPSLGFSVWKLDVAGYWFNPGSAGTQYGVLYLGFAP